ncbi:UvrB/UvrC motif-containing protein [Patescibacteria group bacterium]|nr:UvrB/UvrC motif-containing protein [Patescibacteria group bacterium]
MRIVNLLHFYQPHNQQRDILDRIVCESYRPLLKGLLKSGGGKLVVNITGGLVLLLVENEYNDVLEMLVELLERGQIELTGTAMYHALLPLLPRDEIISQITTNEDVCKKYFHEKYRPSGFFSPEMAINDIVIDAIARQNYKWFCAPAVSYGSLPARTNALYKDKKTGLYVFFRDKGISSLILSASVRSIEDFIVQTRDLKKNSEYWFNVMDAETFGHHRIGHEKFLIQLWESDEFENITIEDLLKEYENELPVEEVDLRPSTWTNQEQDFWLDKDQTKSTVAKSYILWKDPENPIHTLQWELTDLIIKEVHNYKDKESKKWKEARAKLDTAVASDQYWWASAKPWWSLEMIEQGAYSLKDVIKDLDVSEGVIEKANDLYRKILDQAFNWQRSGYIRQMHLANSGTYMKEPFKKRTPPEWFNQVMLEFEFEMNEAVLKKDFERAIKWRDALEKIKLRTDIYDVLHVVDELWLGRNLPWATPKVKPFLEHEWHEFSEYIKGYFKYVSSEEEFEEWKRTKRPPKNE